MCVYDVTSLLLLFLSLSLYVSLHVYIYIHIYVYICIYICVRLHRLLEKDLRAVAWHATAVFVLSSCMCIIVAIFYPFSQFCEIGISLLSLQKQSNTAPNLFQRGVEYGKYVHLVEEQRSHGLRRGQRNMTAQWSTRDYVLDPD